MVNDAGQLYTMEGVAAGLIMLLTAYIVVSTTSVYTTGDTHIPDMQLEQLGSDVLAMMDTRDKEGSTSRLTELVTAGTGGGETLRNEFLSNCKMRAADPDGSLQAQVFLAYNRTSGSGVNITPLSPPSDPGFTGRENAVRVTRWVQLTGNPSLPSGMPQDMRRSSPQAVLVEVLLWRA